MDFTTSISVRLCFRQRASAADTSEAAESMRCRVHDLINHAIVAATNDGFEVETDVDYLVTYRSP